MANKDATITLSVDGADESRVDIEKVREAVEDFGDEGVRIAGPVTSALNHIQGGWDKIADKIQNGKVVTQRDVALMVQQYAHLESAINQAFGSAANAPKELQDALKKAEAQVKSTTQTVGQMDDAVKDNAGNVKVAAGNWPGLGNAIEAVGGKFGKITAGIGLFGAALKEGIAIGNQFNAAVGTDMSEAEKTYARFGMKVKLIIAALSTDLMNMFGIASAAFTGNVSEMSRAWTQFQTDNVATWKTIGEAVTKHGADWDKLHPSVEKVKDAQKAAAEAAKEAAAAAEKLAKEQAALREKIDETTQSLHKNILAEKELKGLALDAEHGVINRTGDLAVYGRTVEATTAQLAAQSAEVARLTAQHGANDPATNQARERLVGLESSLKYANERYREAEGDVKKYEDQQKAATSQLERTRDAIAKANETLKEQKNELANAGTAGTQAATGVQAAAVATTSVANAAASAAPKLEILKDAQGHYVVKTSEAAAETKKAAVEIEALDAVATKVATSLDAVAKVDVKGATADIAAMAGALEIATGQAAKLRAELEGIAELGGSGEGSAGGGEAGASGKVSV